MNRLYGDRGIQDSQLSLSVAGELHFELEDVVAVLFLEVQRFAMKFRIENRRRRVRLVGGLWLLQVPVRVDIDVQAAVSPEIWSPAFNRMVQITLSLNFASHVPANFFWASASWHVRGRQASKSTGANRNLRTALIVANPWPFAESDTVAGLSPTTRAGQSPGVSVETINRPLGSRVHSLS